MRRFFSNIKRTIAWFPVIWRDRDWDYSFLLKILDYKLKRMSESNKKYSYHLCANRVSKQLDYARALIEMYRDSEHPSLEAHREKWGDLKFVPCDDGSDYFYMTSENCHTEEEMEQERKEFMAVCRLSEERKQKTKQRLFNHIAKYIEGWWF